MSGVDKALDELRRMIGEAGDRISDRYENTTRPRLAALLEASAIVAIRTAAGEDTTTARIALESSILNLTREERALVVQDGREFALRAVVSTLIRVGAIAAGGA
jgi:hypothetical protein